MTAAAPRPDGLRAVRTAIHLHTDFLDGTASPETLVRLARETGTEALVITDHHGPHAAREGWHGWQADGTVLVVVGSEERTRSGHDILALGTHLSVATGWHGNAEALALLRGLGAKTFLAHPEGLRRLRVGLNLPAWRDWQLPGWDGLEIWSYMQDWTRSAAPWRLRRMVEEPAPWIHGPVPEVLDRWDEAARERRVAGLGALDSHGRMPPLGLKRLFPWAAEGILPYRQNLADFAHYTLVPLAWENADSTDTRTLVESLAAGAGWVCHEALGCGRETVFVLEDDDGGLRPVGSETRFARGQRLRARLPREAELRLLCRGTVVARSDAARELVHRPGAPGEFRLDVRLAGRPWIFTNHIYLRGSAWRGPDDAPVPAGGGGGA